MKVVIFDLDKTLIDSAKIHRTAIKEVLKEKGFDISKFEFIHGATSKDEIFHNISNRDKKLLERLVVKKRRLVVKLAYKTKPLPYAIPILKKLKKKMKVCLLTSNSKIERKAIVRSCKLILII
jgi:beta-phosphoglucomutase-like phosphatase (HAD superfamily)